MDESQIIFTRGKKAKWKSITIVSVLYIQMNW